MEILRTALLQSFALAFLMLAVAGFGVGMQVVSQIVSASFTSVYVAQPISFPRSIARVSLLDNRLRRFVLRKLILLLVVAFGISYVCCLASAFFVNQVVNVNAEASGNAVLPWVFVMYVLGTLTTVAVTFYAREPRPTLPQNERLPSRPIVVARAVEQRSAARARRNYCGKVAVLASTLPLVLLSPAIVLAATALTHNEVQIPNSQWIVWLASFVVFSLLLRLSLEKYVREIRMFWRLVQFRRLEARAAEVDSASSAQRYFWSQREALKAFNRILVAMAREESRQRPRPPRLVFRLACLESIQAHLESPISYFESAPDHVVEHVERVLAAEIGISSLSSWRAAFGVLNINPEDPWRSSPPGLQMRGEQLARWKFWGFLERASLVLTSVWIVVAIVATLIALLLTQSTSFDELRP